MSLVNTDVRDVVRRSGAGAGWNAQATPTPVPEFQPQFHSADGPLGPASSSSSSSSGGGVEGDSQADVPANFERSLEEHYRLYPNARPTSAPAWQGQHSLQARARRNIDLASLGPVDLVFIIDGSGSIGFDNFERSLEVAARIVEELPIGPDNFQCVPTWRCCLGGRVCLCMFFFVCLGV